MKELYLGLSTHRKIAPEALDAVKTSTLAVLSDEQRRANAEGKRLVMLNSLAEGGDTLCAEAALALGIPYIALLPRPQKSYLEDFSETAREEFLFLCSQARELLVSPDIEGKGLADYDYLYRQASIYVAAFPDIFLALWDGVEGKAGGCGAAEAYDFAHNRGYNDPDKRLPRKCRRIIHILTPREGKMQQDAGAITYSMYKGS